MSPETHRQRSPARSGRRRTENNRTSAPRRFLSEIIKIIIEKKEKKSKGKERKGRKRKRKRKRKERKRKGKGKESK